MQMTIGERLRTLRREKKLSQKEIGESTGLPQSYLSLVENGHTVPGIQTLEKLSRALGLPMYQLFRDGELPSELAAASEEPISIDVSTGSTRTDGRFLVKFHQLLGRIDENDRRLLFSIAQEMANR